MALVLRVLGPERGDRGRVLLSLARLGLEQLTPAVEPEPAQLAPLLGPVVDEESRIREDEEVLDTGELPRVLGSLRLVVERTVDPRMAARRVLADDETDR